jgi:CcmD family protein
MMRKSLMRYFVACAFIAVLVTGWAAPLAAQQPTATAGQGEFVPVKDLPKQEDLPAAPLVMGAYAFVWVALIVYVWSLSRRLNRVQGEIAELRRRAVSRK